MEVRIQCRKQVVCPVEQRMHVLSKSGLNVKGRHNVVKESVCNVEDRAQFRKEDVWSYRSHIVKKYVW
jgi:hypothetical protein